MATDSDKLRSINDQILDKEVTIKLSLRQLMQIAVLTNINVLPGNQCQIVYDRIVERLQKLPQKIQDKFADFLDDIDAVLPPEWPEEIEDEL